MTEARRRIYQCKVCKQEKPFLWTDDFDAHGNEGLLCTYCACVIQKRTVLISPYMEALAPTVPQTMPSCRRPLAKEYFMEPSFDTYKLNQETYKWSQHLLDCLKLPEYKDVKVSDHRF
jgi:hypothetical protein